MRAYGARLGAGVCVGEGERDLEDELDGEDDVDDNIRIRQYLIQG